MKILNLYAGIGGNGASGSESLWKSLIATRKALDVAMDALKGRHEYYEYCATRHVQRWDWVALTIDEDILQALEQINEITKGRKQ